MSTPLEIITLRGPASFASDPGINDLITEATLEVSETEYNTDALRNKAIALIVMHWLALKTRDETGGTAGVVKSEKEGDLASTSGASGSIDIGDPYYSQTSWGLEFIRLQNQSFMLPRNRFV